MVKNYIMETDGWNENV